MKIAVVTDSNSGITQAQAKEMGVAVLPMPFMIDGEYPDVLRTFRILLHSDDAGGRG